MPDPEFDDHVKTIAILFAKDGHAVGVVDDLVDGIHRLAITGKVAITPPEPPAATTAVIIAADTPLVVSQIQDTFRVIATGMTFTIQQIEAGAAGDPNEKGSVVEVFFAPSGDTTGILIIARVYLVGFTTAVTPNTSKARDGTSLDGNGTAAILIRRRRIGGQAQEIDAVVRGFEQ